MQQDGRGGVTCGRYRHVFLSIVIYMLTSKIYVVFFISRVNHVGLFVPLKQEILALFKNGGREARLGTTPYRWFSDGQYCGYWP